MFLDESLSVVDVKAKDSEGRLYQIEIQLLTYRHLPERMVYTWCDIISQQLQSGNDYSLLKPVYSIWLLAENLLPGETDYAHEYKLQNRQGRTLADLGGIHLLELKKFTAERIETEEQRWLQFFKEGEQLDETALPDWMNTDEEASHENLETVFRERTRLPRLPSAAKLSARTADHPKREGGGSTGDGKDTTGIRARTEGKANHARGN